MTVYNINIMFINDGYFNMICSSSIYCGVRWWNCDDIIYERRKYEHYLYINYYKLLNKNNKKMLLYYILLSSLTQTFGIDKFCCAYICNINSTSLKYWV